MKVSLNLEALEAQLENDQITSPAIIRIFQDHIDFDITTPDGQAGIEVGLRGSKLVLVLRNYTGDNDIKPQVFTLYDYRQTESEGQ